MWLQRKCKGGINPPRSQNQPSLLKSKILTSKLVSWEHREATYDRRGLTKTFHLTSASTAQHYARLCCYSRVWWSPETCRVLYVHFYYQLPLTSCHTQQACPLGLWFVKLPLYSNFTHCSPGNGQVQITEALLWRPSLALTHGWSQQRSA